MVFIHFRIPITVTTKAYSNATKNEYAGKQNNTGTYKRVLIFILYSSLFIVTGMIGIGLYIKQKSGNENFYLLSKEKNKQKYCLMLHFECGIASGF